MNIKKEAAIERISEATINGGKLCPDVIEGLKALISTLSPCAFLPVPEFEKPVPEPKTMPIEIRYKAGDIVKCARIIIDSERVLGKYGMVVARDEMGRIGVDWFDFVDGHRLSGHSKQPGHGFWVAPEALEFITHVAQYDEPLGGSPYPEPEPDEGPDDDDDY